MCRGSSHLSQSSCLALAALLSACRVNPSIDSATQIACASTRDCPASWVCQTSLGLCVRSNEVDTSAPALTADPVFSPPAGAAGTLFHVAVQLDEPLLAAPTLTFDDGPYAFEREAGGGTGQEHVFTYFATGREGDGAHKLRLHAVDLAGNAADIILVGPLFDFAPPAASPLLWSAGGKPAVNAADTVEFQTFTESGASLDYAHVIALDGTTLWDATSETTITDGELRGSFAVADVADESAVQVEVSLRDPLGNVTPQASLRSEPVPIDVVAPRGAAIAFVAATTSSETATLEVRGDSASAVQLFGDVLETGIWKTMDIPGTLEVSLTPGAGQKIVTANLADPAGNVADAGSATILYDPVYNDMQAPRVVSALAVATTAVRVFFSESMDQTAAETVVHYGISPALTISAATYDSGLKAVVLTTAEQTPGASYILVASDLTDLFSNALDAAYDTTDFVGYGQASPPLALAPVANQTLIDDGSGQVTFAWDGNAAASSYTLQVFADAGLNTLVAEDVVTTTEDALTLTPGWTYSWRVAATISGQTQYGTPQTFAFLESSRLHVACPGSGACSAGGNGTKNAPWQVIGTALAFAGGHSGLWTVEVAARDPGATYEESLRVPPGVSVVGGYDASFNEATRDPQGAPAIIHTDLPITVWIGDVTASTPVRLSGLTLRASDAGTGFALWVERCSDGLVIEDTRLEGSSDVTLQDENRGLIMLDSGTSPADAPLIDRCTIIGSNTRWSTALARSAAALVQNSYPTVRDSVILGGSPSAWIDTGALQLKDSGPLIIGSTLIAGQAYQSSCALRSGSSNGATPVVRRSRLAGPQGSNDSGTGGAVCSGGPLIITDSIIESGRGYRANGVTASAGTALLANNLIVVEGGYGSGSSEQGVGIWVLASATLRLSNNVIYCTAQAGYGVAIRDTASAGLASTQNNLISDCSLLLEKSSGVPCTTGCYSTEADLNTAATILDVAGADVAAAAANVADPTMHLADLGFVDAAAGNYHLTAASPDALRTGGKDARAATCGASIAESCGADGFDFDGAARPGDDGLFSRGPYEYP